MNMTTCRIWGTPAIEKRLIADLLQIDSPRAGGKYSAVGSIALALQNFSPSEKAKLTTWIIDQHQLGVAEPKLTSNNVVTIKAEPPLSVTERRDRLLQYIQHKSPAIGGKVWLNKTPNNTKEDLDQTNYELMAWTESCDKDEVRTLKEFAFSDALIQDRNNLVLDYPGLSRLEELEHRSPLREQAFVAMWFNDEMKSAYDDGFEPGIKDAGYKALRADKEHHNNKVDDWIITEIRRSHFLVADFTCGIVKQEKEETAIARGGVYYEAGFAQGLKIPVIWTCREDQIDHVHFDTRQFNHIVWEDEADLREQLKDRIGATIGDGPLVANIRA